MLDRSSKLDDSLMDAYRSIHEVHKGHAAGDSDIEKQASQLASDIRYKAKSRIKDGMNPEDKKRVYLSLLSSSPAPAIVKTKAKRKLLGESVIGEEGYDHWRDKHLERGGIGAVASKSPSRPYTRSGKQPKGDTAYQKEMKAKHGGKLPSALDVVKSKIEKEHGKGAIMKTEETSAADKIINSIRSKRVDEGKLVHGPFGPYITGQKMPKEQREVPLRKVPYEDINSAKKVVGEAKAKEDYHSGQGEKIQKRTKKWMDKKGLEGAPGLDAMKARTKEHEERQKASRGVKEEVGVSSSAAMIKARQEAELKSKEEAAVKKAKKAKNEEVEHIDELKTSTLRNYVNKASIDAVGRGVDAGIKGMTGTKDEMEKNMTKAYKRQRGINRAANKLASRAEKNEEVAPAVEKVIEAIKINKASPKSPNCIIMPKKDDIADKAGGNGKKSTKSVVTKKQKQFFNQEDTVKTFRQFVTETEYVDEGVLSFVKGAAKSSKSLAKGAAKVGGEVVKGTAKEIGTAGAELGRGVSNVAKHGGRALQTGASEFKKTGSIGKGIEAGGRSMEKRKILSNPTKYAGVQGPVTKTGQKPAYTGTASDLNKQSKQNWRRTKAKIGKRVQQTKDGLEVASNIKHLQQDQEDKSRQGAGGKVGERQAPT